jgi:hypothetical protein
MIVTFYQHKIHKGEDTNLKKMINEHGLPYSGPAESSYHIIFKNGIYLSIFS